MSALSSPTTCPNGSIVQQLGFLIVLLSILVSGHAAPRPIVGGGGNGGGGGGGGTIASAVALPTQLFFNELLQSGNEDNTYLGEQLKYQEMQQQQQQQQQQRYVPSSNYFANKWPSLHDLLLTADYDDMQQMESNERELANSRLLARLHRLGDNGAGDEFSYNVVNDFTDVRAKKFGNSGPKIRVPTNLGHNTKKNVQFRKQYMSPCHFKICNMGRKRSVPSNAPY